MKTIVRVTFGSHLYGTATPASDLDFKSVFVPSARDILLQKVKGSISNQRPKAEGEKNVAGEIDEEAYSLQRYLNLAAEGQTVALDVLFAPRWAMVGEPNGEWLEIERNRHRLLTKRSASFIGYARTQANKYGIKGSRVEVARSAKAILDVAYQKVGPQAKLGEWWDQILIFCGDHEAHTSIMPILGPADLSGERREVLHWEVCNRKMPYTQTVKEARELMRRIVGEYGRRARQAESNQGVDWKALSHAVRVGRQAIELLETGNVTFPRPEAAHLIAIKTGQLAYAPVAEEIEMLLGQVETAAERSTLQPDADREWIDGFVAYVHGREVLGR